MINPNNVNPFDQESLVSDCLIDSLSDEKLYTILEGGSSMTSGGPSK